MDGFPAKHQKMHLCDIKAKAMQVTMAKYLLKQTKKQKRNYE